MASLAKPSRPHRPSGALMIDLQKKMRCVTGLLRIFHRHPWSPKQRKAGGRESPPLLLQSKAHTNRDQMNGHKNSPIGPDREDDVSPARKKLDCSIDEIDLIGVADDDSDEEEEEEEEKEGDEEDEDQRRAKVWRKEEDHATEMKKKSMNLLHTSARLLHRSNSSPEERTYRSNGYSSNIQYQSRSPVLLNQARRSSVQFAKNFEIDSHLQWSPGIRRENSDVRSRSYTNGSSERPDSSSSSLSLSLSSSSSSSSSSAPFFSSAPESRRSAFAEWKKSLRALAKLGSGSNGKNAQEMAHVIAAIPPPRSGSSPLCQNPNFNTRSSSSSSSSSSSRASNIVMNHSASHHSCWFSTNHPHHHHRHKTPSPSPTARASASSAESFNHRNTAIHESPRFSLDDRELLMHSYSYGGCHRCNLCLRRGHHHSAVLDQNSCSACSASPSNLRAAGGIVARLMGLDDFPTLIRSKSDREYSNNKTCNLISYQKQRQQMQQQKQKTTNLVAHTDEQVKKLCDDQSSSSCLSALMANSIPEASPSVRSSSSSSSSSSPSSLTQKLFQTVVQGSLIGAHPSGSPSSPSAAGANRCHGHGDGGSRLLLPKKQIRDGLPPIVILKQQKQQSVLLNKIHGNMSSSQKLQSVDPTKIIKIQSDQCPVDHNGCKAERKTLKQILEALEKKGLLNPKPYITKSHKPDDQTNIISSDSTQTTAGSVRIKSYDQSSPAASYCSVDQTMILKPLPNVSTEKKKMMMTMKIKRNLKMKMKMKTKMKMKKMMMKKKKMMMMKMKNQQCFSDDLQQTKTNSDSNGETIESEISVTVPSSSSASCSPVSVLELSPAAPILNSDKDAKDSAVITAENCNAELNRNESAMAGLENDNQKSVCGSAATDHTTLESEELKENREFLYTQHVVQASGFLTRKRSPYTGCTNPVIDEFAMAARWLDYHHHHHDHNHKSTHNYMVDPSVYDQLEEYWEDLADELAAQQSRISSGGGGGVHGSAMEEEGPDIGGELYRKSREAAMRRKLLFDCVNEVLGRMARAMVKKAVAMEPYEYCYSQRSRSRGHGYCYQELRRWESDGVVSVWRVIEEMEGGEGAMASSRRSCSMIMSSDRLNRKKKKKMQQEEYVGEEDLILLMVMMMIRNVQAHHGHGHGHGSYDDDDDDDPHDGDGDGMVAIVAGQVEAEMLDSIVQDLLTLGSTIPP